MQAVPVPEELVLLPGRSPIVNARTRKALMSRLDREGATPDEVAAALRQAADAERAEEQAAAEREADLQRGQEVLF